MTRGANPNTVKIRLTFHVQRFTNNQDEYDSPEEIAVLAKQITMSWNEKKSFDVNF